MAKNTAKEAAPTASSKTTGTTGAPVWGGRVITSERNVQLQGRNLFTTFDNLIANTAIVGAAVRYFQSLVGGTAWTVTPKEEAGAEGERAAKLVRDGLIEAPMEMPWSTVVKKASLYKYYGFSIHEWSVRRRGDGQIVYKSIEHRPQHTIDRWDMPDGGGELSGVWQLAPGIANSPYVPRNRMWYCVDNTLTDSPNGVGLLRHVAEKGDRLKRYEQLEGFGYEGDMRGMPVGRVPGAELLKQAADQADPQAWFNEQVAAVHALVRNHIKTPYQGIVLDSAPYETASLGSQTPTLSAVPKWAIDIVKGSSAGLAEIHQVIERLNREIARVLGMEFLLLGGDGKGSLALSRDKTSSFAAVLEATLGELTWFAMHDLVYPLLELNGIDPEKYAPQLNPDPIATERIETVVDALSKLAAAGAVLMPDDPAIDQVRQRLHLAKQPALSPEVLAGVTAQRAGLPVPGSEDEGSGTPRARGRAEGTKDVDDEKRPNAQEREAKRAALFRHVDDALRRDDD
jgi:hypothetical protein